jgi:hypothetical protein
MNAGMIEIVQSIAMLTAENMYVGIIMTSTGMHLPLPVQEAVNGVHWMKTQIIPMTLIAVARIDTA